MIGNLSFDLLTKYDEVVRHLNVFNLSRSRDSFFARKSQPEVSHIGQNVSVWMYIFVFLYLVEDIQSFRAKRLLFVKRSRPEVSQTRDQKGRQGNQAEGGKCQYNPKNLTH